MLALYRRALALRRKTEALGDGALRWLDSPEGVLAFARDPGFACLVNISAHARTAAGGGGAARQRAADGGRLLPPDTAAWLTT